MGIAKIFIAGIPISPAIKNISVPINTIISVCGASTILNSKTIAGYSNLTWDNGSTATTRTVTSSGAYWWQLIGTNVVTNGNFSSTSPAGFTSSYTNMTTGSPNGSDLYIEGKYAIGSNPKAYHSSFTQFGDHTTGSGNMLIVNGASTANVTVWTQNINIAANTDYVFSVWVTSATASAPAILQFSINGSPLGGTITPSGSLPNGTWQYFTTTWNSGSNSSGTIALVNQNRAASGNDFAIDDIVFAPVHREYTDVTLNLIPVLALNGPHTACGVYDLTKTIVGYDPATYYYVFKDSGDNIITLANAQAISQSGTYTITEQNKSTGCTSLLQPTTVTINPNPAKPGIS